MFRVLIVPLISIIFILGIIWLIKNSNKRINEALIKVSEDLDFLYSPPKIFSRKKLLLEQ